MGQLVVIKYLKGELMNWENMLRKDEEDISEYTDWLPMGVEPFKTMDHSKFVEDIKFIEDNILPKVVGIINTLGIKSFKLELIYNILSDAHRSISGLANKRGWDIMGIKRRARIGTNYSEPSHEITTIRGFKKRIVGKLLQLAGESIVNLETINTGLTRNLTMAEKFINLAKGFDIEATWEEHGFNLRTGNPQFLIIILPPVWSASNNTASGNMTSFV